mgnify:CR=1 FL=1
MVRSCISIHPKCPEYSEDSWLKENQKDPIVSFNQNSHLTLKAVPANTRNDGYSCETADKLRTSKVSGVCVRHIR